MAKRYRVFVSQKLGLATDLALFSAVKGGGAGEGEDLLHGLANDMCVFFCSLWS